MNIIKFLRAGYSHGKKLKSYYVVDYKDDFVLYWGTRRHCISTMEENYGGLAITNYNNLSPKMKAQVDKEHQEGDFQ